MKLTRDHFEGDTLFAMDQVALLLFASQQLRRMARTFRNSVELSKVSADPDAVYILKFLKDTSREIMTALYGKESKRTERLSEAYDTALDGVTEAIARATKLSVQERAALKGTGAQGNVIEITVLGSLERLRDEWLERAGTSAVLKR